MPGTLGHRLGVASTELGHGGSVIWFVWMDMSEE